jgi:HAE1 family hydrophobic/amphiphilic exporter-1
LGGSVQPDAQGDGATCTEARARSTDLAQLPVAIGNGPNSQLVPLQQVARIKSELGPAIVNHLDRANVIKVEGNIAGRSLTEVMADITSKTASIAMPPGVTLSSGGQVQQQNEVFTNVFIALGVAVALMYLILVVQFGSFLDPIAILISLPLSLIGVMGALAITGNTINIMSLIGVILLCGIVAEERDPAHRLREVGARAEWLAAPRRAHRGRCDPLAADSHDDVRADRGMIPGCAGTRRRCAQFRAPLGVAVIWRRVTSTVLTLLVIPTFYEIFDGMRTWFSRRVGLTAPHTGQFRVAEPVPDSRGLTAAQLLSIGVSSLLDCDGHPP